MKCIKAILKVLLFLFLVAIIISFTIENIVVSTFSQEILSKKVSGYLLDEIVYDFDINELEIIENNIRNSKSTEEITSKFINTVIENIIHNEKIEMNIEDEIDILISKYIPNEISEEKLQNMKENVIKQMTNAEETLQDNLSFGNDYLIVLKVYNLITNIWFRIIIIILCLLDIVGLYMLEKHNTLKSIRNINLIITIFTLVIFVLIKLLFNFIDQRLAGGWLQNINTNSLIISIIIEIIISILLIIIDKTINSKVKKEKLET